jgi:hypothetical protein
MRRHAGCFLCNFNLTQKNPQFRNFDVLAARQLRARVPYLVGPKLPTYYNFRAGIQSFQDVARHFPGVRRASQTTLSFSRPISRRGARSAARPFTISCGSEAPVILQFSRRDSIFSRRCAPFSGRLARRVPNNFVILPAHQPEGRTLPRPYQFRAGFNLFKAFRRHFRATRFADSLSRREARNSFVVLAARQPEGRTVSRALFHISWVRGFRAHTISWPGFNLFKLLRRHLPADSLVAVRPSRAAIPATETPLFRSTIGRIGWNGCTEQK